MASGAAKVAYGAVVGTGADLDVKSVGFRPRSVELINMDSGDELKWSGSMPDAGGLKRQAAGTSVVLTTTGVTPLAAGFRLGADTDMNVAGETVHFVATE